MSKIETNIDQEKNVLIVDDDRDITELIVDILTIVGVPQAHIRSVDSLTSARKAILTKYPDLIFLDYKLSDNERGTQLLEEIEKGLLGHLKFNIVIISASQKSELPDIVLNQGPQGYIRKPFDLEEIEDVTLRFLSHN